MAVSLKSNLDGVSGAIQVNGTDIAQLSPGGLSGVFNEPAPATVASGATVDLGSISSKTVNITGTTTIGSFGTSASGVARRVIFSGVLTLTHNSTSLILPGAANIVTAAGDVAEFLSQGSGNWRCVSFSPAAGELALTGGALSGPLSGTRVSMANFLDKTVANATATGTVTLDLSSGDVFELTLTGNTTVALSNLPTLSNETLGFVVRVTQGATAFSLTWFSGVTWLTTNGTAPDAPAANKTIEYVFTTRNGTAFLGRKGAAT